MRRLVILIISADNQQFVFSGGKDLLFAVNYCRDREIGAVMKNDIPFSVEGNPTILEWHFIKTDSELQLWFQGDMVGST